MLTNKNSIKLPQNTKYPAQRAAYYKFAVALCVVQIFTFRITSAGSPAIFKGNEQKSLHAAWEQVSERRWAPGGLQPAPFSSTPTPSPPGTGWSILQQVSSPAAPGQHARCQPCGTGTRCPSPATGTSCGCRCPGTLSFDSGHQDAMVQSVTRPVVSVQERVSVLLKVYFETVRKQLPLYNSRILP